MMNSHLGQFRRELEEVTRDLTEASLAQGPPGRWSSAQILEHLYLTYKNTNKGIAKCLEAGAPLARTKATLKQRVGALLVVGLGHMPGGAKAPERSQPHGMPVEEVRSAIFAEIQAMESGLEACERRFGARAKIMDHPILGPLTTNQWRRFHCVHGRHHVQQILERAKSGKNAKAGQDG